MISILSLLFSLFFSVHALVPPASTGTPPAPPASTPPVPPSEHKYWTWQNTRTRYQYAPSPSTPPKASIVCVHGFGGNADHWRRNAGPLSSAGYDVYSIDLLGFGYSTKRLPDDFSNGEDGRDFEELKRTWSDDLNGRSFTEMTHPTGSSFNFYTWGEQLNDFHREVVEKSTRAAGEKQDIPRFLVANSIGSSAVLQATIDALSSQEMIQVPDGVVLLNPSLRGLNFKRFPSIFKAPLTLFQKLLRTETVGEALFSAIANRRAVSNVLREAYADSQQVSDELVSCILNPGLENGAREVFLDFISYSGGPVVEEQLKIVSNSRTTKSKACVKIGWGEKDPWENPALGASLFRNFDCVVGDVELFPGVGHCSQDEAPEIVNSFVLKFLDHIVSAA